jgi:alpha-glucosidase (family GH31 glycosyl hydrolase)
LHGAETYRVPWQFDDESSVVLSKFTKLKNRLEPYLTTLSIDGAVKSGHPLMRAMFLEFPEDPTAWLVDSQYMLGEALLVAPIFDEDDVEYYVPPGTWTSLLDGSRVDGGTFVNETHSFMTLPLLLRQDYALIIGREGHNVLERISEHTKGFTVVVSSSITKNITVRSTLRDGAHIECSIQASQGNNGNVDKITVSLTAALGKQVPWEVLVIGNGVGLDSTKPSTLQQAKGQVCEIIL